MRLRRSIEDVFSEEELTDAAIKAGFLKRKSKVSPSVFFDLMMYDVSSGKSRSLNQLAIEARSEHDIGVTKQGVDKKFNDNTLSFLKLLIEKQLSLEMDQHVEAGWLHSFNRVTIKDSTRFNLPQEYKNYLPGSGGSASDAGACLQFEFDLKSGGVLDLNLTAANRPDVKDALNGFDLIEKNDLVIRDLGYYSFSSLTNIMDKGAFFISRLGTKNNVYEGVSDKMKKLDFKNLYHKMKKGNLSSLYKEVFIGSGKLIPVRLVIELIPEAIYEQRMRRIHKLHRKKGYQTSEKYLFLARFNLFITNVPLKILPNEAIQSIYRIRWQIELIFKIWKSVIGIHHTRKMKYKRWLCLLHLKLLLMIINWNIIMVHRNLLFKHKGRLLSLNKCFKTLFDNLHKLRDILKNITNGITKFIRWVTKILQERHWLEKKNKTIGLEKILYLFSCKSNEYMYI